MTGRMMSLVSDLTMAVNADAMLDNGQTSENESSSRNTRKPKRSAASFG